MDKFSVSVLSGGAYRVRRCVASDRSSLVLQPNSILLYSELVESGGEEALEIWVAEPFVEADFGESMHETTLDLTVAQEVDIPPHYEQDDEYVD